MKTETPSQKMEKEKDAMLRQSCFEKAQQALGYSCDVKYIIKEAKLIEDYIKNGK